MLIMRLLCAGDALIVAVLGLSQQVEGQSARLIEELNREPFSPIILPRGIADPPDTHRERPLLRELAERWCDAEYWASEGNTLDSMDCGRQLLATLALSDQEPRG